MATAWKGLNPDGTSRYRGSGKWSLPKNGKPGGLHLRTTTRQMLSWLRPPVIYVAECDEYGPIVQAYDQVYVLRARVLYRWGTTE
jgi:hypothetical protein